MDREKNMYGAVTRLISICDEPSGKAVSNLIKMREKMMDYLLNKNNMTPEELRSLAECVGIEPGFLEAGGLTREEAAVYIAFLDALLYLITIAPYKRKYFILVLIMCVGVRKNRRIGKKTAEKINELFSSSYRHRMCIEAVRVFRERGGVSIYSVCPRCKCTLAREYQSYCDRCGQALNWKTLQKASVIKTVYGF